MLKNKDYTKIESYVKKNVSTSRFLHCQSVGMTAMFFNQRFNVGLNDSDCYEVGLLHDVARNWNFEKMLLYCKEYNVHMEMEEISNPVLLHAPVAASLIKAKNFNEDFQKAVRWHTLGSKDMGKLGLLLYLSDYLEPRRTFLSDIERMNFNKMDSLEQICIRIINREIKHRKSKKQVLARATQELYDFLKEGGTF